MKWRENKDRFLFIGERVLNAFVTIARLLCIVGIVAIVGKSILSSCGGDSELLTTWQIAACIALFVAFIALRQFSKWLEKKHFELKEIVFGMDILKGDMYAIQNNQNANPNYVPVPVKRGSLDPEGDLEKLIGLDVVKDQVRAMQAAYAFEKDRAKKYREKPCRHMAFIGNPGTGKTTVARIMAGILANTKQIKRNIYVECTGNDLVSEYAGDTKNRVAKIYNKARNGVLFIDEAYVLAQSSERAPEALAQLLTYMENDPDTVVIFAGYEREMNEFIAMNSGLASRISQKLFFEDYNPTQLFNIFNGFALKRGLKVDDEACQAMVQVFYQKLNRPDDQPFSNGRYARNCLDAVYQNHALRYKQGLVQKEIINKEDILTIIEPLLELD